MGISLHGTLRLQFAIVLGASFVASAFWWRDWRLPVVAILAGPLLLAAKLITLTARKNGQSRAKSVFKKGIPAAALA